MPGILGKIARLGLNIKSGRKFIPPAYKLAPPGDRIALLQGLMDADGSISETRNRLTYNTTSDRLALDVVELVECLGGVASRRVYDRSAEGKPTEFPVRMRLPVWVEPFSIARKRARYRPGRLARPCRNVKAVIYEREEESACIAVDAPDQLYATEHAILTHNTIQVLAALPRDSRVIVVCPAAVKGVWQREFRAWRPEFFVQVLHGRGSFRWPLPRGASILNFDILPEQVMAPPGTVLVCDEAHSVKSPHAERTKRFRALADGVLRTGGRVWLLTGTPLKNRPPDLWNVLRSARLEEDAFGSYPQFVRMFGGRKGPFGMTWPDQATHPIDPAVPLLLQRVSLRRHRKDVLPELPEKTVRDVPVLDLPHDTRSICDEAMEALQRLGVNLEEVQDLTELTKLGKPAFDILAKARAALAVAKLPTMEALIGEYEAQGEPLVVFSAHRGPVEAAGARKGWGIITGAVNATTRTETVAAFQAGQLRGIALTIGAGGVGLTLTHSPHALFVDLAWTPADNSQAEDRVYRIGQTRGVTITRLIADHPIDQHVTKLLTVKQRTIEASVEASAVGATSSPGTFPLE